MSENSYNPNSDMWETALTYAVTVMQSSEQLGNRKRSVSTDEPLQLRLTVELLLLPA
jgi:hypothetical protein